MADTRLLLLSLVDKLLDDVRLAAAEIKSLGRLLAHISRIDKGDALSATVYLRERGFSGHASRLEQDINDLLQKADDAFQEPSVADPTSFDQKQERRKVAALHLDASRLRDFLRHLRSIVEEDNDAVTPDTDVAAKAGYSVHQCEDEPEKEKTHDAVIGNTIPGTGKHEVVPPEPTGNAGRSKQRRKWLAEAMLLVRDNPEWSNAKIAREVGVHPSSLTKKRCPEFHRAAAIARQRKEDRLRGHISVDPDKRLLDVEAIDGGKYSDRGQAIKDSQFFREYCEKCDMPMRVTCDEVGKNPLCQDCQT